MKIVGALLLTVGGSNAFQISSSSRPASSLNMASTKSKAAVAPRFDKATQKWIITDPDVSDSKILSPLPLLETASLLTIFSFHSIIHDTLLVHQIII